MQAKARAKAKLELSLKGKPVIVKEVVGTWKAGSRTPPGAYNFYVFKADGTFCQYSPKRKLLFADKWRVKDSKTILLRRSNVWVPHVMGKNGVLGRQRGFLGSAEFKAQGQTKTIREPWDWIRTFGIDLTKQSSLVEFEEYTEKDGTK
jgi:hypothetical protein